MVAQWQLTGCCGSEEVVFLCFYGGYVLLFALIYKTTIMKPMRLLAVFLHEFSHAFLCWVTCGKVEAIEVNNNEGTHLLFCFCCFLRLCQDFDLPIYYLWRIFNVPAIHPPGGVTKYRGGCRILIIPAGYVGCAFWAGLFVSMSGSRIGGTIVAAGISFALLVSLWYVKRLLRVLCIVYLYYITCNSACLTFAYLYSPPSFKLQTQRLSSWYIIGLYSHKRHCDID